jgi:hypothetical protein
MALYIRSEHVDRLARALSQVTGEGITEAVGKALAERLERVQPTGLSPSERERREGAEEIMRRARASCLAYGASAPSKAEVEEMLGLDGY